MPRTCPYCQFISVDRTAHKIHLRLSHPTLIGHCLEQSIKGQGAELHVTNSGNFSIIAIDGHVYNVKPDVRDMIVALCTNTNAKE